MDIKNLKDLLEQFRVMEETVQKTRVIIDTILLGELNKSIHPGNSQTAITASSGVNPVISNEEEKASELIRNAFSAINNAADAKVEIPKPPVVEKSQEDIDATPEEKAEIAKEEKDIRVEDVIDNITENWDEVISTESNANVAIDLLKSKLKGRRGAIRVTVNEFIDRINGELQSPEKAPEESSDFNEANISHENTVSLHEGNTTVTENVQTESDEGICGAEEQETVRPDDIVIEQTPTEKFLELYDNVPKGGLELNKISKEDLRLFAEQLKDVVAYYDSIKDIVNDIEEDKKTRVDKWRGAIVALENKLRGL